MTNIQIFTFNPFAENTNILWDKTGEGVIIDPGCCTDKDFEIVENFLKEKNIRLKAVWLTHGHPDHICGVKKIAEKYDIRVYMASADRKVAEEAAGMRNFFTDNLSETDFAFEDVAEGNVLKFGNTVFEVIGTPGHTPGSVCFYCEKEKILFSGDTIFRDSIGRTDLPYGDYDDLIRSIINKIMNLDANVTIYPGHGPATDVSREAGHNPFLEPFNEPCNIDPDSGIRIKGHMHE